jgi:thioredoxin-like negative regulator of GroEL
MSKQEININAVEETFNAVQENFKEVEAMNSRLWDAIIYLSKEVLTCNQADKFSEYLNRDKEKEAKDKYEDLKNMAELFKKDPEPTAAELDVSWPSKLDTRGEV